MNVITANKNKSIMDKVDIEILKRIDGEYELKDLLSQCVNLYFNKMIIDITSIKDYKNLDTIKNLSKAVDPSRVILLLSDDEEVNSNSYMSNLIECGFYNFTRNYEGIKFLYNTPNTYDKVKYLLMSEEESRKEQGEFKSAHEVIYRNDDEKKVIGLVNLTNHAGATSLTNLMVRQLNQAGISAVGLEMFRQDLIFYHDSNLSSCFTRQDLESKLKLYEDVSAIIIDLNEFGEAEKYCDEILYLVEPSYVKLTKLLKKNRNAFQEMKDKKVVLNMSFVNNQEIPDFEYESNVKVFDNIPPLNDRDKNLDSINKLLGKLGYNMDNIVNNV